MVQKKILITGITGFVGSHLADFLVEQGHEVHGTVRRHGGGHDISNISALVSGEKVKLHECDMTVFSTLDQIIQNERPDVVFHLAAQSFVPTSWKDPAGVMHNNIQTTVNLLESVKNIKKASNNKYDPVILIAGSSEEYGLVNANELPIKESNPLRPLSPYAVSKVACEKLGWQYSRSYGLKTIVTRAFNHEGPRRGKDFVISNFAYQIAQGEKSGRHEMVLKVGDLSARRDFTHVLDTVAAYWGLAEALAEGKLPAGEVYNVATGQDHTMQEVVDRLSELAKIKVMVERDPARMRPSDVPVLQGDAAKLNALTGWKPTRTFDDILKDTLQYWRNI